MNTKIPPAEFINFVNDAIPNFDYSDWENSIEWKLWKNGYNSAVKKIKESVEYSFKI